MAGERVVMDAEGLRAVLHSRDGVVGKDLVRRALAVTGVAKTLCPVKTGRLRSSIRWSLGQDAHGLFAEIGSDVDYARMVHDGTKHHDIVPKEADVLHFTVDGEDVFVTHVSHPGTKGHPFLTDALRRANT